MTTETPLKKVLVVEDSDWQDIWLRHLKDKVNVISAFSIAQARAMFTENPDLDLIVMDGCVDNNDYLDTDGLVVEFRESFVGPMIAASSSWEYRGDLMKVGCDHESEKSDVPTKVLQVLGLK